MVAKGVEFITTEDTIRETKFSSQFPFGDEMKKILLLFFIVI